jgi:ribonuclease D
MKILELNTLKKVESYFEELAESNINTIAIDIECEMNLHCYGEHLCLIQIYDQKNKILIDPLQFEKEGELNSALKAIFESRNILKITYDVAGDASLIEKLYGIKFRSVFDLRPAVQLLEYEKQSLTYILHEELSVPLIAKKKFQTYNWMRRPIDSEALKYAISDVIYLFDLKDKLMEKIIAEGLLDKYMLMNLMAQNKEYVKPNPEDTYKKRQGYNKLSRIAKNRYKTVYDLRDKYAQKINKSPSVLISNNNLLPLANKNIDNSYLFLDKFVTYRMNKAIRKEFIQQLIKAYRD